MRKWTQDYKEFLEGMARPKDKADVPFIADYKEHHTDTTVHFNLELTPDRLAEAVAAGEWAVLGGRRTEQQQEIFLMGRCDFEVLYLISGVLCAAFPARVRAQEHARFARKNGIFSTVCY